MKRINVHVRSEQSRADQTQSNQSQLLLCSADTFDMMLRSGYTRLSENPEVVSAINFIADQLSIMTIRLMHNTKNGDERIKNELSRKVDIAPCKFLTRPQWVKKIVRDVLTGGNSVHIPHYTGTVLDDIQPLPAPNVSFVNENYGYKILYNGITLYPDEVLHFTHNEHPDTPWIGRGLRPILRPLVNRISQARTTATALMENPVPSIIVKVDGLTEEFASKKGRKELGEQFLDSNERGRPWFIPAEAFAVEQVKPLNINDLAIPSTITLDKRTAAAIVGVPPFIVGEGKFDKEEYNNFVSTRMLPIARNVDQELTRKLIYSPNWYFQFNPRSLYSYSITELAEVDCNLVDRAIIDRNEARSDMGRDPREGLSELAILENYIPYSKIGDQKKLQEVEDNDAKNANS